MHKKQSFMWSSIKPIPETVNPTENTEQETQKISFKDLTIWKHWEDWTDSMCGLKREREH